MIDIKDLHYVITKLNGEMHRFNTAAEEGNVQDMYKYLDLIKCAANMVREEMEFQELFNNKQYAEWSADLDAQYYGSM